MTKNIINVESTESNALASEVQQLFRQSVSARNLSGVTSSLRLGYIRDVVEDGEEAPFFVTTQEDCSDCSDSDDEDCVETLPDACSIEDTMKQYRERSPFSSVANLLTTVKKYEFISLVENAYAQIGNKPFMLKPGKNPELSKEQIEESAKEFYSFLEAFLETNEVRVDEIQDAFNLDTLGEVTKALADTAQQDSELKITDSITKNEAVLERVFQRSDFMTTYLEVIKDTTDYTIGIMWIDDKTMKKERYVKNGELKLRYSIQADAHRVDPNYFWATEDYKLNEVGRAVFRLTQYSRGELIRWRNIDDSHGITGSAQLTENLDNFLELYDSGYRMREAMLFDDHIRLSDGMYDVMISRGLYDIEHVKALGVEIPELYEDESHVPCEIYFSSSHVLRVRVMECADERLGVYTTVFRRKGQSIFGWSLHEFIFPFAKLYEGAIDAIDRSVGKSIGSLIQVDTGVIDDPSKYLRKNEETGEVELDLSEDVIIEFDSTQTFNSPNFKGIPVTVTQLPSDISKLLPVVDFIHVQLEQISGIPNILVSSNNIASALRTNSNFNASFTASAKVIQSLLRESEVRILEPSIRFIFDAKAMSGDMKEFLIETDPEILLSDTLTRELNDGQDMLQSIQFLGQFSDRIPEDKLNRLINTVGREVYHLREDLIPGTGVLSTTNPSTPAQQV